MMKFGLADFQMEEQVVSKYSIIIHNILMD